MNVFEMNDAVVVVGVLNVGDAGPYMAGGKFPNNNGNCDGLDGGINELIKFGKMPFPNSGCLIGPNGFDG